MSTFNNTFRRSSRLAGLKNTAGSVPLRRSERVANLKNGRKANLPVEQIPAPKQGISRKRKASETDPVQSAPSKRARPLHPYDILARIPGSPTGFSVSSAESELPELFQRSGPFRFKALPRELRDKVYEQYFLELEPPLARLVDNPSQNPPSAAMCLVLVDQQIGQEALTKFYEQTTFTYPVQSLLTDRIDYNPASRAKIRYAVLDLNTNLSNTDIYFSELRTTLANMSVCTSMRRVTIKLPRFLLGHREKYLLRAVRKVSSLPKGVGFGVRWKRGLGLTTMRNRVVKEIQDYRRAVELPATTWRDGMFRSQSMPAWEVDREMRDGYDSA